MLGSCFLKSLAGDQDFEMYAFGRQELDLTNASDISAVFKRISPDFVINCAAYTDVDGAEQNRDEAFRVNAEAAGHIARACHEENAVLVHFSTDYVFDGSNSNGYKEDAAPNPINEYGASKLEGEKLIAENTKEYYIVRTSWLYGENGKNFVDTMLKLGKEKESLDVVTDQIGSPTYAHDLCQSVIEQFLRPFLADLPEHHEASFSRHLKFGMKLDFGIYHLTNFGVCSWNEFARSIFEQSAMQVAVKEVGSEAFPRPAARPKCSVLINTKCETLRDFRTALKAYLEIRGH
ncbi:dTDP-4-dehydrorhamnose reductase [Candidatus Peregrinibacteria bacterium]|nr:dTDP-4-dehydrorhamnose reductase [Candidatus Peregrinibacteria bacterium]